MLDLLLNGLVVLAIAYFAIGFVLTALVEADEELGFEMGIEFALVVAEVERTVDVVATAEGRWGAGVGFGGKAIG